MAGDDELVPGQWLGFDQTLRRRLASMARRHLNGFDHLIDDVVSRSVVKWRHISPDKAGLARIERVIASEAKSVLRSEQRARARDTRAYHDPTLPASGHPSVGPAEELVELRLALAEICRRHGQSLTSFDVEVFEHLVAGASIADVVRSLDVPRHTVKRSVQRWRALLSANELGSMNDQPNPPTEPAISRPKD